MSDINWGNPGASGDWDDATAWNPSTTPTLADAVTLAAGDDDYTITITGAAFVDTVTFTPGIYFTSLRLDGGTLTTAGAITLETQIIIGHGTVENGGAITNGDDYWGYIKASGGTLEITGAITSTAPGDDDVSLLLDTSTVSTLKLDGVVSTFTQIQIFSADDTLEIGATGMLSANGGIAFSDEYYDFGSHGFVTINYAGTLKLDGGTLTSVDDETLALNLPTDLVIGYGVIDAHWAIDGAGVVTASGGLLEIRGAVDPTSATKFKIDGSVAGSDLKFEGAIGATGINPGVAFTGAGFGTLDLSLESSLANLGAISGFRGADNASTATSDVILVKGSGIAGDHVDFNAGVLTVLDANGATLETLTLTGAYSTDQFKLVENGTIDTLTICFMPATMIATPHGEAAVETLRPGDLVLTTKGEAKPINWVGRQTVSKRFADPLRSYPIRVRAGSLDENTPSRDLLISPDHALLVGGVLVHAGALVNGTSITRENTIPDNFVYYHIELDDHSLILAEGAAAETFVDNVDRMNFDNWSEYQALYPEGKTIEELSFPRAKSHRQTPAHLRAKLAERALRIGAQAPLRAA